MIGSLLPNGAVAIEAYGDCWEIGLLPAERALVDGAAEKRWREFAAGRNCARRALARLGWPDFPVLTGPNREPLWPPGVLGSITHCAGYCAAAAARLAELEGILGLGIDAELNAPLPGGIVDLICTPRERQSLAEAPGASLPAVVFSAKESVYKAWFSITGRWLGYQDAEIDFGIAAGRFAVRLLSTEWEDAKLAVVAFEGRFATSETHVFTVVTAAIPQNMNERPNPARHPSVV